MSQVQRVRPWPVGSWSTRSPLATASTPSGTVTWKVNVALSRGWSFAGNQVDAPSGSLSTKLPSASFIQPTLIGSEPSWMGSGTPPYRTVIVNDAPPAGGTAG